MAAKIDNLAKTRTGIDGLDEITGGGLPQGKSTLVCGAAGTGKTLFGFEFLIHGATLFNETGVFFTFEEDADELCKNVASFGFDVKSLLENKKIDIDHVQIDSNLYSGTYDLDAIFIRLDLAIKRVAAKRIVLDSIDVLFMSLPNQALIREEIRRLLHWLKVRKLTVIITGESGDGHLTRDGMEEYVSDCVIFLENRVARNASTRLLRIVKYRGSAHGSNEYPFLIGEKGLSIVPVTALNLDVPASTERVSTGIPRLDTMLGGKGYFRGSAVLVSGPVGSGKSSLAAMFAVATCTKGERCLYFSMEEPHNQIVRNMRSVGIDLQSHVDSGHLQFMMTRPALHGLEMHLAKFYQAIKEFKPRAAIFDPISTLHSIEDQTALKAMLVRLINFLRSEQITAHFVALTENESSEVGIGISSLIDSWVQLRNVETDGERNRVIMVLKSRGMAHSNQLREFTLSDNGVALSDVYIGSAGVLTGSARMTQEAQEKSAALAHQYEIEYHTIELERKRKFKDAQVAAIEAEFAIHETQEARLAELERLAQLREKETTQKLAQLRQSDAPLIIPANVSSKLIPE